MMWSTTVRVPVIGLLVAASVAGGIGSLIVLILLVLLARDPPTMGSDVISGRLAVARWAVALFVIGFGLLAFIGAVQAGLLAARLSRA
jgi:Mn2+/Fe2+ NRAMP family transporter